MTDLLVFFKLLSDKTRFKLVSLLTHGEMCVCELAKELDTEQTLVSHHLKKLREAGLIRDRRVGRWIHCSLNKEKFAVLEKLYSQQFGPECIIEAACPEPVCN
jgi:ArsR family transcriptional regulator, arsenate/arsenite/antimonite-responsive transcriptional repressor